MAKRHKPRLGSGARFKAGVAAIKKRGGKKVKDPAAIMAAAGRKKYGNKAFQAMATRGRKRAARQRKH